MINSKLKFTSYYNILIKYQKNKILCVYNNDVEN